MQVKVIFSKIAIVLAVLFVTESTFGQVVKSGEIVFERRTNLEKRYEGSDMMGGRDKSWAKKPKIDEFVLYFNESSALFAPIPPSLQDEDREWSTMKNTTFQDFDKSMMKREFSFYGSTIFYEDSLTNREWIITENRREIAGYNTKQAMWIANDSTRIYAWYTEQIVPSVGPESFNGLPGAILGLAIEDGGVVYFAKSVKPLAKKDFLKDVPKEKSKKTSFKSEKELTEFVLEVLSGRGGRSNSGRMLDDIFIW